MPIEAVIYLKHYDLKNVKQVLRRPMTLLVSLYCLTISLTYDRAGFTYKSLRNHVQKYSVFSTQGVRTHRTHRVCLRHWGYLKQLNLEDGGGKLWAREEHITFCIKSMKIVSNSKPEIVVRVRR